MPVDPINVMFESSLRERNSREAREALTSRPTKALELFFDAWNGHLVVAFDVLDAEFIIQQAHDCGLIQCEHALWVRPIPAERLVSVFIEERYGNIAFRRREAKTSDQWARSQTRGLLGLAATAVMA